jgi:ABC-2 type transport system ATP-binding protein
VIEFDHVTRTYATKTAVSDVSLAIPRGELFALLGPNGAGKTTTIRMLVGLLAPSHGAVRVCGIDVVKDPHRAHLHLGYVPDEPCLYDKLTGREFLLFIADMFGLPRHAARRQIDREIEHFELAEFADELVLDEPMVGLDPRSVRIVKDLLQQRTREGMTVFMSTHTLAMAEEMADRIGIMVRGQLRFLGTVPELRDQMALESTGLEQLYLRLTSPSPDGRGAGREP